MVDSQIPRRYKKNFYYVIFCIVIVYRVWSHGPMRVDLLTFRKSLLKKSSYILQYSIVIVFVTTAALMYVYV